MSEPVSITPAGPTGMIVLRGDPGSAVLAAAVGAAVGLAVPAVRRFLRGPGGSVLWFSPDELMLLVAHAAAPELAETLAARLAGEHALVADLSDARSLFRIEGPGARDLLAKGMPVDFAPASFGPGDLRRSRLGQVAAAVWCTGPEAFELVCLRSVTGFVASWLATAAAGGSPGLHLPR
jgi:sarcosine oxidase subunit gamma